MSGYERKKIDMELKMFISRNFQKASDCKNPEQIRIYVRELVVKIEELEGKFNYVPEWAYRLLAQYNALQNRLILTEFQNAYS